MEGHGRAVVLLHSSMSSKNQWRTLTQDLRSRYRVVTIDLLGYGDAALPQRGSEYRIADEVRNVERILGSVLLPGEPYHLVGHSYGGVVALHVAQRALHRLASLTLLDPVAVHLMPGDDPARREFEQLGADIVRRAAAADAAGAAASFIDYWSGAGAFADLPEVRQRAFARLVPKVLMEFNALAVDRPVESALAGITAPVCIVHGSLSPSPVRRIAARLAALMPRARCVRIDAGHMAPVTDPLLVNPVVTQFVGLCDGLMRDPSGTWAMGAAARTKPALNAWAVALAIGAAGLLCAWPAARGEAAPARSPDEPAIVEMPARADAWRELPASMARGGRYALVSGDPRAAGAFVLRIELEPGFELPAQRAARDLDIVVLSGELEIGSGTLEHPAGIRSLESGYFAHIGARQTCFARTRRGATVQVFGTGPLAQIS
jgi:pimeloyl-ACP methyl ester carboxylesterase